MLKSANNKQIKHKSQTIRVIRNSHITAELAESGEQWADHKGPCLSLADVMAAEAAKVKK